MSDDINVLALVKGEERYIFLFDDRNRSETLRTMGRYASNAELSFTWYDAAVMSQKIRQTAEQTEEPPKLGIFPKQPGTLNSSRFQLYSHDDNANDWFDSEEAA